MLKWCLQARRGEHHHPLVISHHHRPVEGDGEEEEEAGPGPPCHLKLENGAKGPEEDQRGGQHDGSSDLGTGEDGTFGDGWLVDG